MNTAVKSVESCDKPCYCQVEGCAHYAIWRVVVKVYSSVAFYYFCSSHLPKEFKPS